ncbi:MAG: putative acetylglutamate kinase-like protein [Candidatus Tectimicrobiota bacterium]|nr:MAG: putative acetylglutamate kinase-like protein [Candidatus Tectomicrobia bacterium]
MLVVKVGGSQGIPLDGVCEDVRDLVRQGERLLLVHGASALTNWLSAALGKPPRFVTSLSGVESRYTDRETLEIFCMAYVGKMNKLFVERLQQLGVQAVGLCGADGRIFEGERKAVIKVVENGKRKVLRDDYTGRVERVNTALLTLLLDHGYTPVLCPPAISYAGELINVDGDRAAAVLAGALRAHTLLILSNVPGLLRNVHDERSLIPHVPRAELEAALALAQGRMKKKIMGAAEALAQGVKRVVLGDARLPHPIRQALSGQGTRID